MFLMMFCHQGVSSALSRFATDSLQQHHHNFHGGPAEIESNQAYQSVISSQRPRRPRTIIIELQRARAQEA